MSNSLQVCRVLAKSMSLSVFVCVWHHQSSRTYDLASLSILNCKGNIFEHKQRWQSSETSSSILTGSTCLLPELMQLSHVSFRVIRIRTLPPPPPPNVSRSESTTPHRLRTMCYGCNYATTTTTAKIMLNVIYFSREISFYPFVFLNLNIIYICVFVCFLFPCFCICIHHKSS